MKFGVADMVTSTLEGFPYEMFTDFKANPTVTNVKNGLAAFKASGADFLIAIGGGSAIDTSRVLQSLQTIPNLKTLFRSKALLLQNINASQLSHFRQPQVRRQKSQSTTSLSTKKRAERWFA